MKKLVVLVALVAFIAVNTVPVYAIAKDNSIELAKVDDKPKKDKKAEAKADSKSETKSESKSHKDCEAKSTECSTAAKKECGDKKGGDKK